MGSKSDSRRESMKRAWLKRDDYLGEIKKHKIYNCWRSFKFTEKGKKAGYSKEWYNYKNFYEDMISSYVEGYRLCRYDKKEPFSKQNCFWEHPSLTVNTEKLATIKFKGVEKTLKEWAIDEQVSLNGLRQRYYKGKNYTPEEIIFGKKFAKKRDIVDHKKLNHYMVRAKASKMMAQYRLKDKKRGFDIHKISIEWFIENIFNKNCVYCGTTEKIGADRIDNDKGHGIDNIQPCCYRCNVVKSNLFTHDEMIMLSEKIREIDVLRLK